MMSDISSTIMEVSKTLQRVNMYPFFDAAHYILMCSIVKEDTAQSAGTSAFSRRHPFACWLASMLMCFSGSILGNLLIGEPLVTPFKHHRDILLATAIWYVINYFPFDLAYKVAKFAPVHLVVCIVKEVHRTRKIYDGVGVAYKLYPNAYLIVIAIGVFKGSGYLEMRLFERLIRGIWIPASNEFLQPSLLSSMIIGIHDPFLPFENIFCSLFLGGLADALKRATTSGKPIQASAAPNNNGSSSTAGKTKEKKNE
uniref:Trimeric intracellular cation channel type B n=2 Tax=Macrostomum lignano TaxID=282301 RepID=A0A1I8JEA5_9PLAT